jgi:hypothetical protein
MFAAPFLRYADGKKRRFDAPPNSAAGSLDGRLAVCNHENFEAETKLKNSFFYI